MPRGVSAYIKLFLSFPAGTFGVLVRIKAKWMILVYITAQGLGINHQNLMIQKQPDTLAITLTVSLHPQQKVQLIHVPSEFQWEEKFGSSRPIKSRMFFWKLCLEFLSG